MRKRHLFLASLALVVLFVVSCKKEDKEEQKTTAERIQAKWSFDTYRYHEYYQGEDYDTTAGALTTDYFDIRSDNKIYVSLFGTKDTLDYNLQNDSTMLIKELGLINDDGLYKLRNLTDNTLTLSSRETDPGDPANFVEIEFNLKK